MTKFDDGTQDDPIDGLDAQLASDLSDLYAAPVPALRFQRSTAPQPSGWSLAIARFWRPAAVAATVTVALAAVLIGPTLGGGGSQSVSAAEIFQRTSAAAQNNAPASGPQSYHLVAVTESAGVEASTPSDPQPKEQQLITVTTSTEVWYRDAAHQRNENDWNGDGQPDWGMSVSGDDAWMYGDFGGTFRAVHAPASELGASFGDQSPNTSLADVLGQYSGSCQKTTQDGEETIAGRAAYRIVITPDVDTCPSIAGEPGKDISKLGTLIVDVDKETFLPLRTEQRGDGIGMPAYTYTVTEIQVGENLPDSDFTYTAPAGVTITNVANLTEAKNVISGYTPDGIPPADTP